MTSSESSSQAHAFCDKFAIVGLGYIAGKYLNMSSKALQVEAVRRAMADAGLKRTDTRYLPQYAGKKRYSWLKTARPTS